MDRRLPALTLAAFAMCAAPASAHSILRYGGSELRYVAEDATSANRLAIGLDGDRFALRDPGSDGGLDFGQCDPGAISEDANAWVIEAFCARAGVTALRLDLGEREDVATVLVDVPAIVPAGSGADDVTTGDPADQLLGGDGNDRLAAGGGADLVDGGPGLDAVDAGAGDDVVRVRDGQADTVACGDGADAVEADTLDVVAGDCEAVAVAETPPPEGAAVPGDATAPSLEVGAATVQRTGRRWRIRVAATTSEPGLLAASGFLDVAGISMPLRSDRRPVTAPGGGAVLTVRLSAAARSAVRRAYRRGRRPVARLRVVATDAAGNSRTRRAPRITLAP